MHAEDVLKIGDWLVCRDRNLMTRDGICHRLEPKTMAVLAELAARPGKVVSRRELLEKVWPRTFSGDEALTRCVSQLRSFFQDDSRSPRYIETIPKKGYRLVASCFEFKDPESCSHCGGTNSTANGTEGTKEAPVDERSAPAGPRELRATQFLVLIGALVLLLKIGSMGLTALSDPDESPQISVFQAPAYSIYVMPFSNLTSHPADDSFAEGIASTIRSEASKAGDIAVIAAASGGANSNDETDLRKLAAGVGAATILTGSVQRSGNELRITAQLVDGYSGFNIWSKSFDLKDADIFQVQDEIAASVVYEIRTSLAEKSPPPMEQSLAKLKN